jgi:RHS repeat-associated protein
MKGVLKVGVRELDLVQEYTGYPYDLVINKYYAKARMYNAADRRFVAMDPIKGSVLNPKSLVPYIYVMDNPLKYIDPWGLFYEVTTKATVGNANYYSTGYITDHRYSSEYASIRDLSNLLNDSIYSINVQHQKPNRNNGNIELIKMLVYNKLTRETTYYQSHIPLDAMSGVQVNGPQYGIMNSNGLSTGMYFKVFNCGGNNPQLYINYLALAKTLDMEFSMKKISDISTHVPISDLNTSFEEYLLKSGRQILLGNYTEDSTLLGLVGQLVTSFIGIDLPTDLRDVFYDITHFEPTLDYLGRTAIDFIALAPYIGALKYSDESLAILKNADEIKDATKGKNIAKDLLKHADDGVVRLLSPSKVAKKIVKAERIGSGLRTDIYHRAASFISESHLSKGIVYDLGKNNTLLQVEGALNGKIGIFEYILNELGQVNHQLFKQGGIINGIPN